MSLGKRLFEDDFHDRKVIATTNFDRQTFR